jgi:hypothetical protein
MAKLSTKTNIQDFLEREGYEVEEQQGGEVLVVTDEDGFTIFVVVTDIQIEFMVDICGENDLQSDKLLEAYKILLDENELQLSLSSLAQNTINAVEILSPYHKTFSGD